MRHCVLLLLAIASAGAQPVIGVWNDASSDPFGNLAPGTIMRIELQNQPSFVFDPSNVSVQFQAANAGSPQNLTLTYVPRSYWLEALVPYDAPLGAANLTLTFSGQTSTPYTIHVVKSSFGIYTVNSGVGPAKAVVRRRASVRHRIGRPRANEETQEAGAVRGEDGRVTWIRGHDDQALALTNPARPGDEVTLEGTGLGLADRESVSVLLAGHSVPISGVQAGNSPGIAEVRFVVPDDPGIPDGCYVQVAVSAGGNISNPGSIPIARGDSACTHPFGLSFDEMRLLDSGGLLPFGSATISSTISRAPPAGSLLSVESAAAMYLPYNAVNVALATPMLVADDSRYGCTLDEPSFGYSEGFTGSAFNIGDSVTLAGSGGTFQLVGGPPFFSYSVLVSKVGPVTSPDQFSNLVFSPGAWQFSSNGSAAVGPISDKIQLPPQPRLLNSSSLRTIDRTRDVRVAWDPAGYLPADVMKVMLSSGVASSSGSGITSTSHRVTCRVAASDGGVTFAASSLRVLVPDSGALLEIGILPRQPVVSTTPLPGSGVVRTLLRFNFDQQYWVSMQ